MPSQLAHDSVRPVKVLLEAAPPSTATTPIHLHFVEQGVPQHCLIPAGMPVRFDKVVVSSILETLPPLHLDSPGFRSPRNIAKTSFYAGRSLLQKYSAPTSFAGPVFDLRHIPPNNMAHLLTEILPRYLFARSAAGPELTLLLQTPPIGAFAALFALLGVTPVIQTGKITADVVRIQGMRGLSVIEMFEHFDCCGLHLNPNVISDRTFPSDLGLEKIFMARRAPRNLINQQEIEAVATHFGYATIYFEDYTIPQQLGIAANAKHILAIHGAAMAFLAANKHIDSVVELFPPNVQHELFSSLFAHKVRQYHQIVPTYDPAVPLSGWPAVLAFKNKRFAVDPSMLETILAEIHESNSPEA